MTSLWIFKSYSVLAGPAGHRLSRPLPDPPRPHGGATPPRQGSRPCSRQKDRCHRQSRRAGGAARHPPGDGLLGPRKRRGFPEIRGVAICSGDVSLPGLFSCPRLWVSICMEGVFPGMEHYHPLPEDFVCVPVFWLSGRTLDSVRPSPWFHPHVSSFFFNCFL